MIVGLDVSLTATGFAVGALTERIRPKERRGVERLVWIRSEIGHRLMEYQANLVVMEGYSYGSKGNAMFDIGELGGVLRVWLWENAIPYAVIPPMSLKKFATGRGNSGKDEVIAAAIRRWGFPGSDNNEADAWILKTMGEVHMGMLDVTDEQRGIVERCEWPKVAVV